MSNAKHRRYDSTFRALTPSQKDDEMGLLIRLVARLLGIKLRKQRSNQHVGLILLPGPQQPDRFTDNG